MFGNALRAAFGRPPFTNDNSDEEREALENTTTFANLFHEQLSQNGSRNDAEYGTWNMEDGKWEVESGKWYLLATLSLGMVRY